MVKLKIKKADFGINTTVKLFLALFVLSVLIVIIFFFKEKIVEIIENTVGCIFPIEES